MVVGGDRAGLLRSGRIFRNEGHRRKRTTPSFHDAGGLRGIRRLRRTSWSMLESDPRGPWRRPRSGQTQKSRIKGRELDPGAAVPPGDHARAQWRRRRGRRFSFDQDPRCSPETWLAATAWKPDASWGHGQGQSMRSSRSSWADALWAPTYVMDYPKEDLHRWLACIRRDEKTSRSVSSCFIAGSEYANCLLRAERSPRPAGPLRGAGPGQGRGATRKRNPIDEGPTCWRWSTGSLPREGSAWESIDW